MLGIDTGGARRRCAARRDRRPPRGAGHAGNRGKRWPPGDECALAGGDPRRNRRARCLLRICRCETDRRQGQRPSPSAGRRGVIEGVCGALGLPIVFITPPAWKRLNNVPPGAENKDQARARAIARWPAKAELFARKMDVDRAEAALIGWAGNAARGLPMTRESLPPRRAAEVVTFVASGAAMDSDLRPLSGRQSRRDFP